jgi:hypothetical protein
MCVCIQIVRPLDQIAETQPQLQPASLGLSAMIPITSWAAGNILTD